MAKRHLQVGAAVASAALVLTAAAASTSVRWNFDFAQYRGPDRPEPKDEFRFVIVGDRTGGAIWGLMPQVFREINHLYPDFVISVGDLIDGYGDQPDEINQSWSEFDEEVTNLKCPFVYVPGNHDIWNPTSRGVYELRYGPTYRSFNYRGLHFITLSTEEAPGEEYRSGRPGWGGRIEGEQLAWLKADIAQNRNARRILIFMHRPVWQYGGLDPIYDDLQGLPVNIFAGHYHKYSYQEIRGIPHIVLGATAASMPDDGIEAYGRFRHYALATVRDDDFKLALIRLGGVLSPNVVLEEDVPGIRQLADACAIYREGGGANNRIVFRNPLAVPVRLQVHKASQVSARATSLFPSSEPSVVGGAALDQSIDWSAFNDSGSASVAAEYRAIFRFSNRAGEPQSIDFPVEPRTRRSATVSVLSTPPKIDGDLSDWSAADWQAIAERSQVTLGPDQWSGPQDLSAQFALAEDENNLYVAVRVTDDNVALGSSPTESDCVELFTADPGSQEISFSGEANWHRLVVAPFGSTDDQSRGDESGVARIREFGSRNLWGREFPGKDLTESQAAYVRHPNGYVLELALSRDSLGWNDRAASIKELDIAINDRDLGSGREAQLAWSGTQRNAYSSRYYGLVRLP